MERLAKLVERRRAEGRRCYYRMGKLVRARARRPARSALEQFQRAVDLDDKHLPSLDAMRDDLHRRGRLPRGRARDRAGDRGRAERAPRRRAARRARPASTTSGSTSTSARSSASRTRSSSTPTTTAPRCRWSTEYVEQGALQGRRAAAPDAGAQRCGQREPADKHRFWFLLGQVARAARRRRHGGQGVRRGVRARQPAPRRR